MHGFFADSRNRRRLVLGAGIAVLIGLALAAVSSARSFHLLASDLEGYEGAAGGLIAGVLSVSCLLARSSFLAHRELRRRDVVESSLRRREFDYRSLAERASDALLRVTAAGVVTYASPAIREILGYEPESLIGRDASILVHRDDDLGALLRERAPVLQDPGTSHRYVFCARHRDGSRRWLEAHCCSVVDSATGDVLEVVSVLRDVSERTRLDEVRRRRRSALVRAAGRASAEAVAESLRHELNQPLTAIGNHLEACRLVLETRGEGEPTLGDVRAALAQLHRAGGIVQDLRRYVDRSELRRCPIDLDDLVRDTLELLEPELRVLGVRSRPELALGGNPVDADAIQVQQALVGLILAAAQVLAAEPARSRRLAIRTRDALDGFAEIEVGALGAPGSAGDGADDSPLTTAEPPGSLGVATSLRLIELHGGQLSSRTDARGRMAAFRVTLPREEGARHAI